MAKKKGVGNKTVTEFMQGRYGYDQLSRTLIILSMILMIVAVLFTYNRVVYLVAVIILAIGYWRMASKNIKKRKAENEKYLMITSKFSKKAKAHLEQEMKAKKYATFEMSQELGDDNEVYYVYKCRSCGSEQRFPENQGVIKIVCPDCGNELVDRT